MDSKEDEGKANTGLTGAGLATFAIGCFTNPITALLGVIIFACGVPKKPVIGPRDGQDDVGS